MTEEGERFAVEVFEELSAKIEELENQSLMGEGAADNRGKIKGLRISLAVIRRHLPKLEEENS